MRLRGRLQVSFMGISQTVLTIIMVYQIARALDRFLSKITTFLPGALAALCNECLGKNVEVCVTPPHLLDIPLNHAALY